MIFSRKFSGRAWLLRGGRVLAVAAGVLTAFGAAADSHYFSLSKIFPSGKCAPVAPNFELLADGFAGGEMTQQKIPDGQGGFVETITTFINKQRDQWVMVGSKRDQKVIFCLYASGVGPGSVERRAVKSK